MIVLIISVAVFVLCVCGGALGREMKLGYLYSVGANGYVTNVGNSVVITNSPALMGMQFSVGGGKPHFIFSMQSGNRKRSVLSLHDGIYVKLLANFTDTDPQHISVMVSGEKKKSGSVLLVHNNMCLTAGDLGHQVKEMACVPGGRDDSQLFRWMPAGKKKRLDEIGGGEAEWEDPHRPNPEVAAKRGRSIDGSNTEDMARHKEIDYLMTHRKGYDAIVEP